MRRYGKQRTGRSGCDDGRMHEHRGRCIAEVLASRSWWVAHQCFRNRGHGPVGLYCKQHAKMLAAGRRVHVPEDKG